MTDDLLRTLMREHLKSDEAFQKLVVSQLTSLNGRMENIETDLHGIQLRWAKLVGAASVVGALSGWLIELGVTWLAHWH